VCWELLTFDAYDAMVQDGAESGWRSRWAVITWLTDVAVAVHRMLHRRRRLMHRASLRMASRMSCGSSQAFAITTGSRSRFRPSGHMASNPSL
jgi:hypothetical protein